jgi:hypothetical protein
MSTPGVVIGRLTQQRLIKVATNVSVNIIGRGAR